MGEKMSTKEEAGVRYNTVMQSKRAFSLIEVLVVIAVIGILAAVVMASLNSARESARLAKAEQELRSIFNAAALYHNEHDAYPADVGRGMPGGLEEYMPEGVWEDAPWPDTYYDWDNWDDGEVIQISIKCATDETCTFTGVEWDNGPAPDSCDATDQRGVFYCIRGECTIEQSSDDTCEYCTNCDE